MLVAVDGSVRGAVAVADTLKEGSKEAIDELHRMGLKVAMITVTTYDGEAIADRSGSIGSGRGFTGGEAAEVKKLQAGPKGQPKRIAQHIKL